MDATLSNRKINGGDVADPLAEDARIAWMFDSFLIERLHHEARAIKKIKKT